MCMCIGRMVGRMMIGCVSHSARPPLRLAVDGQTYRDVCDADHDVVCLSVVRHRGYGGRPRILPYGACRWVAGGCERGRSYAPARSFIRDTRRGTSPCMHKNERAYGCHPCHSVHHSQTI